MLDHDTCQPTADVVAAIESLRPAKQRPLTREECTTPELRLEYIAQWLEREAPPKHGVDRFSMLKFRSDTDCGTACCIAGAACMFFGSEMDNKHPTSFSAALLLGVQFNGQQGDDRDILFYGKRTKRSIDGNYLSEITPAWAARCIRHYQKTGVVDWEKTR